MSHDRGIQVSRSEPDKPPDKSILYGDPMQVLKCIDHEEVEGKHQRARQQRRRREISEPRTPPESGFQAHESPQQKTAKIEFYEQRDAGNEPWNHDKHGQLSVGCLRQECNVIAESGDETKNHYRVQAAEKQSRQDSQPYTRSKLPRLQPEPNEGRMIVGSPQGKGEVRDDLRNELNQRLFSKPVGKGVIIESSCDRQQGQCRAPLVRLSGGGRMTRLRQRHGPLFEL